MIFGRLKESFLDFWHSLGLEHKIAVGIICIPLVLCLVHIMLAS